ncbi:hypothetical protein L210DRAFT_990176 [Boletus edulis BED1]|uniref:Uncharacterized protein n=1 Tax=Boletus edulis BED1 TaxID=1328754 RepID=A0AAD4BLB0_BOLED|nr:hypothetical protein L210DRAFT_990176 [Boletus edulis BED1]
MPRGSLVTQNDAVPRLGPRRCLERASTRPRSPPPPPAIACMPSPRPTCTDTITRLPTRTARLSFTLARHCDRSHRRSTSPHFVRTPPLPLPRPCPHIVALTKAMWRQ